VPPAHTGSALDSLGIYVRTGKDPSTPLAAQTLSVAKEAYLSSFRITMIAVGLLALVAGVIGAVVLRRGAAVEAAADADDATVAATA
jgi:hypothetical protein